MSLRTYSIHSEHGQEISSGIQTTRQRAFDLAQECADAACCLVTLADDEGTEWEFDPAASPLPRNSTEGAR